MDESVKIFPTPFELAEALALDLVKMINGAESGKVPFTIALSGGNTPKLLFSVLGDHFAGSVNWSLVQFFWVDERCVPPDNMESNYSMAKSSLLDKLDIPGKNIHRILGEEDPGKEAIRYSREIAEFTRNRNRLPIFDIILLGLGEDGHTASIFPGKEKLFRSHKICQPAVHPVSGQKRITLTGRVINNAESIIFLVTGKNKAAVVNEILTDRTCEKRFPASHVVPVNGIVTWFLDKEAGQFLY
jgi:6-phosphogluconolactonase